MRRALLPRHWGRQQRKGPLWANGGACVPFDALKTGTLTARRAVGDSYLKSCSLVLSRTVYLPLCDDLGDRTLIASRIMLSVTSGPSSATISKMTASELPGPANSSRRS